jgi:hypothetical protein
MAEISRVPTLMMIVDEGRASAGAEDANLWSSRTILLSKAVTVLICAVSVFWHQTKAAAAENRASADTVGKSLKRAFI